MGPALGLRHRVDLVDDHGAHRGQHLAAGRAGKQQVEGLGCRHQDMRRPLAHGRALALRSVAGAHLRADLGRMRALLDQLCGYAGQRRFEIALDVVGERLQGRYVHHPRHILQPPFRTVARQRIDGRQERGQRLSRTGGRGNQRMVATGNRRPGVELRARCTVGKGIGEPRLDGGVKLRERHGGTIYMAAIPVHPASGLQRYWMRKYLNRHVGERREIPCVRRAPARARTRRQVAAKTATPPPQCRTRQARSIEHWPGIRRILRARFAAEWGQGQQRAGRQK
jgi:hypothetical protein